MKYSVRRYDSRNWVVERFEAGGTPTNAGKLTRSRWVITGYHPNLRRACLDLLEAAVPVGTAGADIIPALTRAQEAICHAISMGFVDDRLIIELGVETTAQGSNPYADS